MKRIVYLDWLRVIACFLVIVTHANEFYYLGGQGTCIASASDALWATFFVSLCRCCVPLFAIASSFLLFPVRDSTGVFFRKRVLRILPAFAFWMVLYCIFGGGSVGENFTRLAFNFASPAGHLWFVYMIIGLYLLMPLLSPWAERVSRRELLLYIGIWAFTLFAPAIRFAGLHLTGSWALWGEANWSEFGMLYYVSGYIGYLLIGLYLRRFASDWSWERTLKLAVPSFVVGFLVSAFWFYHGIVHYSGGVFPMEGPLEWAVKMEVMLRYCTPGVVLMSLAVFVCVRKIVSAGWFYSKVILPLSSVSYGVYLMHILALVPIMSWLKSLLPAPLGVVCGALCTFTLCSLVGLLLRRIPIVGKYLV